MVLLGEDVEGIGKFKEWISSDCAAFRDMRFTIVDSIAEFGKVATPFVVEGTHEKEFRGVPATHKKFETVGGCCQLVSQWFLDFSKLLQTSC